MVAGGNRLDVGLSAEHEQESGCTALLGMAYQRGGVHVAGEDRSTALRIVGGDVSHRHQQAQRPVEDHLAHLRLLAQRVVAVFFLVLFTLLDLLFQVVIGIFRLFAFLRGVLVLILRATLVYLL